MSQAFASVEQRRSRCGALFLLVASLGCNPKSDPLVPGQPPLDEADLRHNLLGTYDFEDGVMLPWMTSFSPPAKGESRIKDGAMCILVEAAGKQRWDAQLR